MEEFNLDVDKEAQKKKADKKMLYVSIGVVAIIIFVIVLIVCITPSGSTSGGGIVTKIDVQSQTLQSSYTEYLGYSAKVVGVAKNVTSRNFSYVSLEFSVYDSSGNNIGTAWANINNLSAGDTWRYEATLIGFSDTKPISIKLIDITAY